MKFLDEIATEMEVREQELLREKSQLERATARIAEIDAELAVIDTERKAWATKVEPRTR